MALWSAPYCSSNFSTNHIVSSGAKFQNFTFISSLPLPLPLPQPLPQPSPLPLPQPLPRTSPSNISNNVSEPTEYEVSCFLFRNSSFTKYRCQSVWYFFFLVMELFRISKILQLRRIRREK